MIVSQREARDMLEDVERYGEQLSVWEMNFIDKMARTDRNLSYGELDKIDEIYKQRVK